MTAYQSASKVTKNSSVRRHYYACRSTAGGKPRCKGISYPAWDFEHTVSDLFKHPDIWRNLMGENASEDMIEKIVKTWDALIWPWQQIWLKAVITKIEFDPDDGSASMSFDMVKIQSFCDQIHLSVNRPVPE